MRLRLVPVVLTGFCLLGSATDIDTQKSTLTVRAYKTGLFSVFAHDHQINAPIQQGTLSEEPASVEFVVDARKLKALDKESPSNLEKIQTTMLGPEVLALQEVPRNPLPLHRRAKAGGRRMDSPRRTSRSWANPPSCSQSKES